MAKVTQKIESDRAAIEKSTKNNRLVAKIFDRLDDDGSGDITQSQFEALMRSEEEVHELCDAADLGVEDLQEFFEILSQGNGDGHELHISRQAFLEGLERERESVNQRSLMILEKRLDVVGEQVLSAMRRMEELVARCAGARGAGETPTSWTGSPLSCSTSP